MIKKEVLILVLALLLFISGCSDDLECLAPSILVDGVCCLDADRNMICDSLANATEQNQSNLAVGCGDGTCSESENCTTCSDDCGACSVVLYEFTPKNITLSEFQDGFNKALKVSATFRKDIDRQSNVSDFLYYNAKIPRLFGDFLGIRYKFLSSSRLFVIHKVNNEHYMSNNTESLIHYVNYTKWYLQDTLLSGEKKWYESRITSGKSLSDYPSARTGYEKEQKYANWAYRNFSLNPHVVESGLFVPVGGVVELLHASIDEYTVKYKYHEFYDLSTDTTIESYRDVTENRLNYVHSFTFACTKNTILTLYSYNYPKDKLSESELKAVIRVNRASLLDDVAVLIDFCKKHEDKDLEY